MADPWPAEVPASLWAYNQLSAEELGQVPMMGVKFASGFLYAFAFGCVFIAFFAWNRFRTTTEVRSQSRALTDLGPSEIGGHAALIRAYFIYAGAILLLYVSLTFFGKLLFQMMTMVPAIGFSVDADELRFDNAQWPLMLAFGFAGLAQMLPPVAAIEGWLRRRAYRAVGIPVRLEQTMRNLIVTLERAGPNGDLKDSSLGKELAHYRDQWVTMLGHHAWTQTWADLRPCRAEELVSLLSQLELLVSWSRHKRGSWPGHEVSQAVRERERAYVDEADALLTEFQQRMTEKPEDDDQGKASARKARFGDYLSDRIKAAEALRFDLVGILAIFLERDMDSPDVTDEAHEDRQVAQDPDAGYTDPALRKLLGATTRADSAGTGPESGLFVALLAVFLISAAAAWRGLQDPVGPFVERGNLYGILISALVETLRIASLTWLPLLAAFSLRQYWWDNGDWAKARYSTRPDQYAAQILTCLSLGIAAALLGLCGMAALKAFFIATNREYFNTLLFTASPPFLLYYPTQAIVLPALIPLAIHSADLTDKPSRRLVWGVLAALAVGGLSLAHALFWSTYLVHDCLSVTAFMTDNCRRRLDLVGHLQLMALAFLAVGVFGDLPERRRASARPAIRGLRTAASAALTLALALGLAPIQARAEEPKQVKVGFRVDIAPFSYQNSRGGSFHGYLADLCFDIFDGAPEYSVTVVPVEASDRFAKFNAHNVDILCDAVTMRFSERDRSDKGIYSPIVFVSGVSYLQTSTRAVGSIWLGFVLNATARDVARKTCQVDQFRVFMPDTRALLVERCNLRWQAALLAERLRQRREDPDPMLQLASVAAARVAIDKDWQQLEADRRDLQDTARNLARLAGDRQTSRLNPTTWALIDTAQDDHRVMWSCVAGGGYDPLCDEVIAALSDPGCDPEFVPKKVQDSQRIPVEQRPWDEYRFCPMQDHRTLIEWFCASKSDGRRVYLGDRELIVAKRDAWAREYGSCPVERAEGADFLSYEPYALLVRRDDPKLVAFVQRRVYELFSDRSGMTERFSSSFPGRTMSKPLAYLFLLNAVENDTLFLPDADRPTAPNASSRP